MDIIYKQWSHDSLKWIPERGMGYYPVRGNPYDENYFEKYRGYSETEMGRRITAARCELVRRHYVGPLLDVGIGSGQFVESRPDTTGYDVNQAGIDWLNKRGLYRNLYAQKVDAASFWDSLEHIEYPDYALAQVLRWVFVSIPIFADVDHVLSSKHFRPDEHYWYFTRDGFVGWMRDHGFSVRESNCMECDLGREDVMSFAFEREL